KIRSSFSSSCRTVLKTLIGLLIYQRLQRFFGSSWFKLTFNLIKHLTDLKHRHLAGAFFLALIPDNNFVWFVYLYVLIVLIHKQCLYLGQIEMMRVYLLNHETWFFQCLILLIIRLIVRIA